METTVCPFCFPKRETSLLFRFFWTEGQLLPMAGNVSWMWIQCGVRHTFLPKKITNGSLAQGRLLSEATEQGVLRVIQPPRADLIPNAFFFDSLVCFPKIVSSYTPCFLKAALPLSRTQQLYQLFICCQFFKSEYISRSMSHGKRLSAFKSPSTEVRELRSNDRKDQDLWPLQHLWFMVHRYRKRLFAIPPPAKLFHWLLLRFVWDWFRINTWISNSMLNNIFSRSINKTDACLQPSTHNQIVYISNLGPVNSETKCFRETHQTCKFLHDLQEMVQTGNYDPVADTKITPSGKEKLWLEEK